MIKKLNIALGVCVLLGALFIGAVAIYSHVSDVHDSKVAQQVEGVY